MLTVSSAKYLLAIYRLSEGLAVRSVDVAEALGVSKPSVVKMLHTLAAGGYIHKESYGNIQLTPLGKEVAGRMDSQCGALERFFLDELHVSGETAKKDAMACLGMLSEERLSKWGGPEQAKK